MAFKNSPRAVLSGTTAGTADYDDDSLRPGKLDRRYTFEEFKCAPILAAIGGGAPTGATGDLNVMHFPETGFEYHIKGAGQTIVAPVFGANGMDIGLDQSTTEGVEITQGITARSPGYFTVGTDNPFFLTVGLKVVDASGCNPLVIGFRKAEAYQATHTSYADYAAIGIVGTSATNLIKTLTETAGGGTTTTDTTNTWADNAAKTLTVKVSKAGVVTYQINGAAPAAVAAFSFAAGDLVVPFLYFLNAADLSDNVYLQSWECGAQV